MHRSLIALACGLLALAPALAFADAVERQAGEYTLVVDYDEDPPLLEDANALVVRVSDASGAPVSGLEDELQFEVDISVDIVTRTSTIDVRPSVEEPGVYEGVFTPPVLGDYNFRVFGTIEGQPVDERFGSADGLAEVTAAEGFDFSTSGATLAVFLLAAYLVGLCGFGIWWLRRRRARKTAATPA